MCLVLDVHMMLISEGIYCSRCSQSQVQFYYLSYSYASGCDVVYSTCRYERQILLVHLGFPPAPKH